MRTSFRYAGLLLGLMLLANVPSANAEERWVVTVAELPGLAQTDGSGALLKLLSTLDNRLPDVTLDLRVVPFARSLMLVQQGQADLQIPYVGHLLTMPAGLNYGGEPLSEVRFALYTRREQSLEADDILDERWHLSDEGLASLGLGKHQRTRLLPMFGKSWRLDQLSAMVGPEDGLAALAYPYRAETDRAHVDVLGFPALASNNVESSLRKLVMGRIDGYVLAPVIVEPEINRLGLRDQLRGVFFADYVAKWLVADSVRGHAIARRFSSALRGMKEDGEFAAITGPLQQQLNWHPWP